MCGAAERMKNVGSIDRVRHKNVLKTAKDNRNILQIL
jgi:hypothetical protein